MPHSPLNIKTASITIGGVEYGDAVTIATLVPTYTEVRWEPISGNTTVEDPLPLWALNLTIGQDLTDSTRLTTALLLGAGTKKPFVIKPISATSKALFSGTCTLRAPAQLGGGKGIAIATVVLPVDGQPLIKTAADVTVYGA